MRDFTVKQLSEFAQISVRTLHYYDEIGLLKPSYKASNGYRYYNDDDIKKLQQILIYREFGFDLKKIKRLISAKDFDILTALRGHLDLIKSNIEKQKTLSEIITQTIDGLERKEIMKEKFMRWASEERQKEYEKQLIEKYGEQMRDNIDNAKAAFNRLDDDGKEQTVKEVEDLEAGLCELFNKGVQESDESLTPLLNAHRNWVSKMWSRECTLEAYSGLADMYNSSEGFIERFEAYGVGFCQFLTSAMKAYSARN